MYQEVVRRLGDDPRAVVAIEHSTNGPRSAAAAQLHVIAVPNVAYPPAEDALSLANVVVESLDEITPQLVRSVGR